MTTPRMITCQEAVGLLDAWLEGTLEPEDRAALDHHACLCPPCVAFLRTYRATVEVTEQAFRRTLDADVQLELERRVLEALSGELAERG